MNKTVLITGGARGLGAACARTFAEKGYRVVINYHTSFTEAEALVADLAKRGLKAIALKADISCAFKVQEMLQKIEDYFGPVDILVNNAAISQIKLLPDISEAEWEALFAVNVKGTFLCTQAVLPGMIAKKAGKIINISSMWGLVGASCEVAYSASKAAIVGFTKALAKELGPSNIQVNCVAPGFIDTAMNDDLDEKSRQALLGLTPLGRAGNPIDVAASVFFLASAEADFITGQVLSPNGGMVV